MSSVIHNNFINIFNRKSGKDNILKCTYVLPDGITHTKGFVKDMDEARRYLSLPDGATYCTTKMDVMGGPDDVDKAGDRRKAADLTQNVMRKVPPKKKNRIMSLLILY
jgi:hypothetical protein